MDRFPGSECVGRSPEPGAGPGAELEEGRANGEEPGEEEEKVEEEEGRTRGDEAGAEEETVRARGDGAAVVVARISGEEGEEEKVRTVGEGAGEVRVTGEATEGDADEEVLWRAACCWCCCCGDDAAAE